MTAGTAHTRQQAFRLLHSIFPLLPKTNAAQVAESSQLAELLASNVVQQKETDVTVDASVVLHLLSMCQVNILHKQDVTSLLICLRKLGKLKPRAFGDPKIAILLCELLPELEQENYPDVLSLMRTMLASQTDGHLQTLLFLPLLQLAAQTSDMATVSSHVGNAVSKLLHKLQRSQQIIVSTPDSFTVLASAKSYTCHEVLYLAQLCQSDRDAICWMDGILQESSTAIAKLPYSVLALVISLLVRESASQDVSRKCLSLLEKIASSNLSMGPDLLPVVLHCLATAADPTLKLDLLNTLPKLATHKLTVTPVLRTLQGLSVYPDLAPLGLRLLTQLWKQQERCYPQLHKMLLSPWTVTHPDQLISRAASIRDVCCARPEQHGADMLGPLSNILNECGSEQDALTAALALEGLYALCESEVVDVRTVWTVLAGRLSQDKRSLVVQKICELFSLVPILEVDTKEYEEFSKEVVSTLWRYTEEGQPEVVGAAYKALGAFNPNQFTIYNLSDKYSGDLKEAVAQALAEREEDDPSPPPSVSVPGFCYTRILRSLPQAVMQDFETFLKDTVAREVSNYPRSIYHLSTRPQAGGSSGNKALAVIPEFLLEQYERNNQPGLRQGLAAGLLFSYDPPVQTGRDGRPHNRGLLTLGEEYQLMLDALLLEVPIQPSEWHRCMQLPQAWTSFMDRCFMAVLEGRKAEVAKQSQKGQIESEEETHLQTVTAWLWARDKLTEKIKSASRGNPTAQGNSVLALAGVAVCASKYAAGLDPDSQKAGDSLMAHLSQPHWLSNIADTILAVLDCSYQPKGRILAICQQRSGKERSPACLLARACASLALSQLVPVLLTSSGDHISHMVELLSARLPGHRSGEELSPSLQFFFGLSLGMLLGRLFEERYEDVSGTQGMVTVWKALDDLEKLVLTDSENNRFGATLGLGLCLSAMCVVGRTDTRVHVQSLLNQLVDTMDHIPLMDNIFQAFAVCVSCTSGAAFGANIIKAEEAAKVVAKLYQAHSQNQQSSGTFIALGSLCYFLERAGHPTVGELSPKLLATWLESVEQQDCAPLQRVASLNGVLTMIGSEQTLIKVEKEATNLSTDSSIAAVVKAVETLVKTMDEDLGIRSTAAWMLGHMYLSSCGVVESRSSAPTTYQYLSDTSLVRYLVDFLVEAGKQGTDSIPAYQVEAALGGLVHGPANVLPPLNWAMVLSPLLRCSYGDTVQRLCLQLAVQQSSAAATASLLLSSWLVPPLFDSLQTDTQFSMIKCLPQLIKTVPIGSLKVFLEKCISLAATETMIKCNDTDSSSTVLVLESLYQALSVPDPPHATALQLFTALEQLYEAVSSTASPSVLNSLAKCIRELPETMTDSLTMKALSQADTFYKGAWMRCHLVAEGLHSLAYINPVVEIAVNIPQGDPIASSTLALLWTCMRACVVHRENKDLKVGIMEHYQWFLELMGFTKQLSMKVHGQESQANVNFALAVFCLAVAAWATPGIAACLGLSRMETSSSTTAEWESSLEQRVLNVLPYCLHQLLQVEPWKQATDKVIDWILYLIQNNATSYKEQLIACLYALGNTEDYKKGHIWTKICSQ